jgi:hypothetical protein
VVFLLLTPQIPKEVLFLPLLVMFMIGGTDVWHNCDTAQENYNQHLLNHIIIF